MDTTLLIFIIVPIIVGAISFFVLKNTITLPEMIVQMVVCGLIVTGVYHLRNSLQTLDYETWNGQVESKDSVTKACPFGGWTKSKSYWCENYSTREVKVGTRCEYEGEGKKRRRVCRDVFETEYRYHYLTETNWYIKTSFDEFKVDRVNPQGNMQPARWTSAYVGEPASTTRSYVNWIKAASTSLFNEDGTKNEEYKKHIPEYPHVRDMYRVNRFIDVGVGIPNSQQYNTQIGTHLVLLGKAKQLNATFIIVDAERFNEDYSYAVRRYWEGFKKNDAVIFIGVTKNNITWANVLSWSKNEMFNVRVKDMIMDDVGKPAIYTKYIYNFAKIAQEEYQRREMKEFEYLRYAVPTTTGFIVFLMLVSLLSSAGLIFLFHQVDIKDFFKN